MGRIDTACTTGLISFVMQCGIRGAVTLCVRGMRGPVPMGEFMYPDRKCWAPACTGLQSVFSDPVSLFGGPAGDVVFMCPGARGRQTLPAPVLHQRRPGL